MTAGVLAVTAMLSMTAPPSQLVLPTSDTTAGRSTSATLQTPDHTGVVTAGDVTITN